MLQYVQSVAIAVARNLFGAWQGVGYTWALIGYGWETRLDVPPLISLLFFFFYCKRFTALGCELLAVLLAY